MTHPIARYEFVEGNATSLVLSIDGEIDLSNVGELRREIDQRLRHPRLVIDFRKTTYIDSAGLALIADVGSRPSPRVAVHIVAESETTVWRTLRVAGFTELFPVHSALDAAVAGPS
jgi:anti-anti-sigma factor